MEISYRLLNNDDVDEILAHLNQHYTSEDVLALHLGITDNSKTYFTIVRGLLEQGNSFGAFHKRKLVGCLVNAKIEDNEEVEEYLEKSSEQEKKIIRAFDALLDGEKIEGILGTRNFWEVKFVCINKSFNGMGIWTHMHRMSLNRAKDMGCKKLISYVNFDRSTSTAPDGNVIRHLKITDFVDPISRKKEFEDLKPPYTWIKLVVFDV